MINKNIYITYPAGYMGTYINWLISISDQKLRQSTVTDPLTANHNAHGHTKYPTHLSWSKALTWMAKNRPAHPLIYALNTRNHSDYHLTTEYAMQNIMRIDSNPVFINCHDNDNDDVKKFGALNMFRKWPTFISAISVWHNDYNPAADTDVIRARNWLMHHWKTLNPGNRPVNPEIVMYNLKGHRDWLSIRRQTAPAEITDEQYLVPDTMPTHLVEIPITDIIEPNFVDELAKSLAPCELGNLDWSYARSYHSRYVEAQDNRHWFRSIEQFRTSGLVDQWFFGDAMSQAFLLLELNPEQIADMLCQSTRQIAQNLGLVDQ